MDTRKIKKILSLDTKMMLDEIENIIFDEMDNLKKEDIQKIHEIADVMRDYLHLPAPVEVNSVVDYLPEIDILKSNDELSESECSSLMNKISDIAIRLENDNLRNAIQQIITVGKQEAKLASELEQDKTGVKLSSSLQTFFTMSEELWQSKIQHQFRRGKEIQKWRRPQELSRDLFKRLMDPDADQLCYIVVMKTNGKAPLEILNEAESDFFTNCELYLTREEADSAVMNGPIIGTPLCIELELNMKKAKEMLQNNESLKPFVRNVNGATVRYQNNRFEEVDATPIKTM